MRKGGLLDMNPEEMQEPQITLDQLIQSYMQQALATQADTMLNQEIKSKIMLNMAQALNLLVPLGEGGQGQEQELALKAQSHQLEMQQKQEKHQADLQFAAQKHQLDLETSARKHQLDSEIKAQQAEQKAKEVQNKPKSTV